MIRRPLLLVCAVLALAAGAVACGGDSDSAADAQKVNLVLDWFPNADHAGIYGAMGEGYFADEGLDVTPTVPSDPAASLKQVGAGKAPFAISYEPEVLLARSQGVPVVAVGAIVTHPLNAVIARTDRGISRPRELEGKTVGATGLPTDRPLLDAVVRSDGGDPAKVKLRNVGFNLAPALAAGKVDAVIGAYWNIEGVQLERQGIPVESFRLEQNGVPDYDELVVVTSDEVARKQPELVRAFLRGAAQGAGLGGDRPERRHGAPAGGQQGPRRDDGGRAGAADRRPLLAPRRTHPRPRSRRMGGDGRLDAPERAPHQAPRRLPGGDREVPARVA